MDTMQLPLEDNILLDGPLFASLTSVDDLWGDDFFQLLRDTDMAMDEDLPALPCQTGSPGESGDSSSGSAAPLLPSLAPKPTQQQQQSQILLPNAVCKRRPISPAPGHPTPQGLPALGGGASTVASSQAAAGCTGLWRTVTTAATPGAQQEPQQLNPAISVPAAIAAFDLSKLPSLPAALHLKSCSSSESPLLAPAVAPQPPAAKPSAAGRASIRSRKQVTFSSQDMSDSDSEDSNDTEEDALHSNSAGDHSEGRNKTNKRKAPEVDWRSIEDPAERRRQRRLAKNRVTAARSRERKKTQWVEMEEKLNAIEAQNTSLREMLEAMSAENTSLRQQLASALSSHQGVAPPPGATGNTANLKGNGSHGEPAALVLIATLLLLCAFLPNNEQMSVAFGGAAPLALLAALLSMSSSSRSWKNGRAKGCNAAAAQQAQHEQQDCQQRAAKRRAIKEQQHNHTQHTPTGGCDAAAQTQHSTGTVTFMQVYAFVLMLVRRVRSRVVKCLPPLRRRLKSAVSLGGGVAPAPGGCLRLGALTACAGVVACS